MTDKTDKIKDIARSCVDCGSCSCDGNSGVYPEFCATTELTQEMIEQVRTLYVEDEENSQVAVNAALVEAEGYGRLTRIEEIADFAQRMGFKTIGIATSVLRTRGFQVYGIGCKVAAQPKTSIGIDKKCESSGVNMCNPILQARLLNEHHTDLNVVIGLCVGHDSLFYKYSDALATTLVTKDRVLAHNPCAALYQLNSYYSRLLD